jgi:hypothetical protein
MINQTSGAAGLAHWMRSYFELDESHTLDKRDARLAPILEWIHQEYEAGRVTSIGDEELERKLAELQPKLYAQVRPVAVPGGE